MGDLPGGSDLVGQNGGEFLKIRWSLWVLLVFSVLTPLFFLSEIPDGKIWSLWPPLVAIVCAFVTKRLVFSLGLAVSVGGLLLSLGEPLGLGTLGHAGFKVFQMGSSSFADPSNLQILGFVFFVLAMIQVMEKAGGLQGIVDSLKSLIRGRKSCERVTAALGVLIFIDDYANTMIVGSTMKNVSDRFKVSREKLAFLVDATSAPIAGVALISTWVGYEVGLFGQVSDNYQWSLDGYGIFLQALSFRFYCFFMLFFVFANVLFGVDFGPMKKTKPVLFTKKAGAREVVKSHLGCGLIPLVSLLIFVFAFFWWDGGGYSGSYSLFSASSWQTVLMNSENGTWYLCLASLISWALANSLAFFHQQMNGAELWRTFLSGIRSSILPVVILVLAWSMKTVCDDLNTGLYVVNGLGKQVPQVWLPCLIFIVSALTAFATGTSWGTMAILIPTVSPLAVDLSGGEFTAFTALSLAAILDGAIMGDHCSPVSDTTVMSSISTGCDLVEHVRTQMPYVLIVGGCALGLGYLPQATGFSWALSMAAAFFSFIGLFYFLSRRASLSSRLT